MVSPLKPSALTAVISPSSRISSEIPPPLDPICATVTAVHLLSDWQAFSQSASDIDLENGSGRTMVPPCPVKQFTLWCLVQLPLPGLSSVKVSHPAPLLHLLISIFVRL